MNARSARSIVIALFAVSGSLVAASSIDPPEPAVVTPGSVPEAAPPTPAPSDAIVLFDGVSLDKWQLQEGKPAPWTAEGKTGGAMTVKPDSGSIVSRQSFGSAQIHIEFATPMKVDGEGQGRGNSGVYIQGRYELQVLDSFNNSTYPNGQCGAIYGQSEPLVNACRGPGQWQTYDIIFHAAKFSTLGERTQQARVTVLHNGVLIQDNSVIDGPTGGAINKEADAPGPIMLQDHGNLTRFRNVWVRPLGRPAAK